MRIGLDVDGVFADFNESFIKLCIEKGGCDLFPPRPFDIPTWYYPQHYGYSDELMDFETGPVWAHIKESGAYWSLLQPYPWTMRALTELNELAAYGHDIYFITDRPGRNSKAQTERWLRWSGYAGPTVLISSKKGLVAEALDLDVYIDDRDKNVIDVLGMRDDKTKTFLFTQPWNRDWDSPVPRLDPASLSDYLKFLGK